ncbi:aldo/keto reductase [Maribellus sp. CM-23]|uniref:aldo/keto reductase n=1 Tax=Maribellus sp. CM-23 TaxID=2781026 RepID=UPI001F47FF50|nr:aldo/keto reductase [Maribellus sp. CM-23]MCE4565721.1 aldo/keto reductase [Maribellus sp. CM-23]
MASILNQKEGMEYRRFGKTEKHLSVITLGGMRFKHGWDEPRNEIPKDTLEQCLNMVRHAFDAGMNHIETAWGYKKSETVYGKVLNEELSVPRSSYHLMTKGNPLTTSDTRKQVETQLKDLQTDYLDFYGWHGLNTQELFEQSSKPGGAVEELLKLKEEGIIRHVGFSTHAPLHVIIRAIESGLFEFVNLHYYYFDQRNLAAVNMAQANDMGVFIISPNDKGGQLFRAPEKVRNATSPLTPIQWNARFCLQNPAVHTLSFGMTESEHFEEMKGIFPFTLPWSPQEENIKLQLDSFVNDDPFAGYDGYDLQNDPSEINIPQVLRLRKLWKCYDMKEYAQYRYKIFEQKSHWFPGVFPTRENIAKIDCTKVPSNLPLKEMLAETHRALYVPDFKLASN